MNSEHYRLEALKLAVDVYKTNINHSNHIGVILDKSFSIKELADTYFEWIIQDQVKAEQAKQEAEKPQYKIPPSQRITQSDQRDYLSE